VADSNILESIESLIYLPVRTGEAKAGIIASVSSRSSLYMVPLRVAPKTDLPALLGGMFGMSSLAFGWIMHFVIGIVLALIVLGARVDVQHPPLARHDGRDRPDATSAEPNDGEDSSEVLPREHEDHVGDR
jgi:hypothetical protein